MVQSPDIYEAFVATMGIYTDPGCDGTKDSVIVLGSSPSLDVTMVQEAAQVIHTGTAPTPAWPWIPIWPMSFMISGATDISKDTGCSRVTDPDRALGCFPGLVNTMTSVDRPGHPNWPGTDSGTVLRHQHGHSLRPSP